MNIVQSIVYNKKIALIGNASSIFNFDFSKQIDSCDVVVRMNAGYIKNHKAQGIRTDILALSLAIAEDDIVKNFNPKIVIWATSKRKMMPKSYKYSTFKLFMHPLLVWLRLRIKLKARPSTGAIVANYIYSKCNPQKIEMYGFDFFKSKTFYNLKHHLGPHVPCYEEEFFKNLISSGKVKNMQDLL